MERKKTIGWIGTGVMGDSMCSHLVKAGYNVNVYNRTKSKTENLVTLGAKLLDSPKEVAQNSDVIFTIVGYPQDVEEIYLGENGIINNAKEGSIIIDMTTSTPSLAEKIFKEAKSKCLKSLDAPVTGGDIGAKNGQLVIFVGGDKETFDEAKEFFNLMSKDTRHLGSAGSGQHAKMANQISVAACMVATVETLLYAQKAGLDLNTIIDMVGSGAGGSFSLNNLGRRVVNSDFNPGFFIKHFVKDMGIALEEAKKMNLMLPGLSQVHQFYLAAIAQGYENLGTQALYKVLQKLNNQ